jgi:sulfopyruvate decarboxylase TPP-binding subunit
MLSLVPLFRLPFFTIVTMRGEWGEFNHWQVPMGSTTQAVFEISGIKVLRANTASECAKSSRLVLRRPITPARRPLSFCRSA